MRVAVRAASRWAYRALLRLRYDTRLRQRFGSEMLCDLDELLGEALERRGLLGAADVWMRMVRDLLRPSPPHLGPERASRRGTGRRIASHHVGRGWEMKTLWQGAGQDVRFALRSVRREPRFSALLVGVMALGIAANAAVFSVVNAYLLRPLPYPHSERIVSVAAYGVVTWNEVDEIFDLAVSWDLDVFTIVGEPKSESVRGAWITPDFLEMYAVEATLGRTFADAEGGPTGQSVALISHRLWQERFGADPDVLGRTFRAYTSDRPEEAEVFEVIGVLPRDFWYVNPYTEVLVPIREERTVYTARLRPGVSAEQAEAYLTALALPRLTEPPPGFRARVGSLHEQYVSELRPTLVVLQVAVLLVLLIACANAAVLLLMRGIRREREMGLRRALGAGRGRLARQLLAEGLLVAGVSGLLGAALAAWAVSSVRGLVVARLGRTAPGGLEALTLDGSVLAATLLLTAVVGLLFGLVPLATSAGGRLSGLLGSSARAGDTKGRRRARHVLVAAELTLTLALLMGAGLMVRSSLHLASVELGFRADGVVRGLVGLRARSYPTPADRHELFARLAEGVRELPGVSDAAVTSLAPYANNSNGVPVEGEGASATVEAVSTSVGEGFFATLDIGLLRGRDFVPEDGLGAEPVAIVSESLARALWPGRDPIGQRVRAVQVGAPGSPPPEQGPYRTVVGVVADIQRAPGSAPAAGLYRPFRQDADLWMSLLAKLEPGVTMATVVPEIERALAALDPEAPLQGVTDLEEAVQSYGAATRFLAALLVGFALFAALLAVLGIYGVIAYATEQRRRDVAIRMALGADGSSVARFFFASGVAVAATGVALGSLVGLRLGTALESQLLGVSPWDPTTHVTLAVGLFLTALLAVWLPARRAARGDPMGVLREET